MTHNNKKLLYEVSIIRPLVIFLLVFLHSFEKIADGGGYHQDYQLITAYRWILWIVKGFRIETIALVAGYVFAYQSFDLGRKYPFWSFVRKKFFRLIIPMLFFGVIYYFCFFFKPSSFSVGGFVVSLLSGCGHLWFLPMLFWCFIAIWIIDRFKLNSWVLLIALAVFSILPTPSLPFGFGRLPHFLFFVYAGYFLWTKRNDVLKYKDSIVVIVLLWAVYLALVVVKNTLLPTMNSIMVIAEKIRVASLHGFVGLLLSCVGIMALYLTVCHFTEKENFCPKPWVIAASGDCYGVYVFHQFILVWLYFFTPLVASCPNAVVPWVGFAVALSISFLLTKLSLKTRFGRFLIG